MHTIRRSARLLIRQEHLLNPVMIRMFELKRSSNTHIERKKSKMTLFLTKPDRKDEKAIEKR